jgi:hypothetical protein
LSHSTKLTRFNYHTIGLDSIFLTQKFLFIRLHYIWLMCLFHTRAFAPIFSFLLPFEEGTGHLSCGISSIQDVTDGASWCLVTVKNWCDSGLAFPRVMLYSLHNYFFFTSSGTWCHVALFSVILRLTTECWWWYNPL